MAIFTRAPGVLAETLDDRAALVTPDGRELVTLNRMGTQVWEALARLHEPELIAAEVSAAHPEVGAGVIRRDVDAFLAELSALDLVRVEP